MSMSSEQCTQSNQSLGNVTKRVFRFIDDDNDEHSMML